MRLNRGKRIARRRNPESGRRRARERRTSVVRPSHGAALRPALGPFAAAFGPALAAPGQQRRGIRARTPPPLVEVS
ncbi:hypothetical protein, partial [Streptomyces sp. 12257]|uniref:hypothetical protein n=1 Tax=Streptomyces sp. 12257 TaxID=3041009 RepID=UPI0024A872AA